MLGRWVKKYVGDLQHLPYIRRQRLQMEISVIKGSFNKGFFLNATP
jgi:hypothetical protein